MLDFFSRLFDTSDFPARWHCGTWTSDLGWLHIASDLVTFLAFVLLPAAILTYLRQRGPDVSFPRIFWLFATFIFVCGCVHLVEAIIFWFPIYRFSALLKFVTAAVSTVTVITMLRLKGELMTQPAFSSITEELKREIERRAKVEQRLTAVLDNMIDGVIVSDDEGNIEMMNSAAEKMFHFDEGERTYAERFKKYQLLAEDGRPLLGDDRPLRRAAKGDVIDNEIVTIFCPTKNIALDVLIRAQAIKGGQGGAVGVLHDIRELRMIEQDRNLQIQRLERMTDSAARVTHAMQENSASEEGYMRVVADVFGCPVAMLVIRNDERSINVRKYEFHAADQRAEHSVSSVSADQFDWKRLEKSQDTAVSLETIPDFDPALRNVAICGLTMEGEIKGALLVSDREARFSSDELDLIQRIARLISSAVFTRARIEEEEKARQQAEAKLEANRKQLARVIQVSSVGELTAGIAHELNQPLTALINYTDMALQLAQDEPQGAALRELQKTTLQANQQAIRAADVLRSVRSLVRRGPIEFAPVNILEAMKVCCRLLADEIVDARATVGFSDDTVGFEISADRIQIEQLFVNLIRNAIQAVSQQSHREIRLDIVKEKSNARIEIIDSGPGFADGEAERLFDAFYTTREKGLGLGLKICRSIVEMHGGSISAANHPGFGARFTVILPLEHRQADTTRP